MAYYEVYGDDYDNTFEMVPAAARHTVGLVDPDIDAEDPLADPRALVATQTPDPDLPPDRPDIPEPVLPPDGPDVPTPPAPEEPGRPAPIPPLTPPRPGPAQH